MLTEETFTFGKYNGLGINKVIRDRKYCDWLLQPEQSWFREKYEYLYNRIKEYNPKLIFLPNNVHILKVGQAINPTDFCLRYEYFNLTEPEKVKNKLQQENDYICYKFYYNIVQSIKLQILENIEKGVDVPYDIKTPNKWLIKFEKETNFTRDIMKEFIEAYELLNIISIIERIKKEAGIVFNGARSFIIAKERSVKQEVWWEKLLKDKYDQDIGVQFKFQKCIFDFIHINNNTLYECKLSFKDFSSKQYKKYLQTLDNYKIIYLIGYDTIINFDTKKIYTFSTSPSISDCSTEFLKIISEFETIYTSKEDIQKFL